MNGNCLVCGSPTKSHHVATADGSELYCCHSCWTRRTDDDVQEALAEYNVLTGEGLDELREEFRTLAPADLEPSSLPPLPVGEDLEVRRGTADDVIELAGTEHAGEADDFDSPFAGVVPEVDLPRDPADPVYAAFAFTTAGGPREAAYVAWLCIGEGADALADAIDRLGDAMRGSPDV